MKNTETVVSVWRETYHVEEKTKKQEIEEMRKQEEHRYWVKSIYRRLPSLDDYDRYFE